jgi:hypothetical protein
VQESNARASNAEEQAMQETKAGERKQERAVQESASRQQERDRIGKQAKAAQI